MRGRGASTRLQQVKTELKVIPCLIPPDGQTCGDYMADDISRAGGYLLDPSAMSDYQYCKIKEMSVCLAAMISEYDTIWRNFGITRAYIILNTVAALTLYWVVRMLKGKRKI